MLPDSEIPHPYTRPGFSFYLLMSILIAGGLMVLSYLALLQGWYGELLPAKAGPEVPPAWLNSSKIVLVDSRCPGEAETEMEAWQRLLRHAGVSFETAPRIPVATESTLGVIVLPATSCLGDGTREAILGWLRQGGGVVFVGTPAASDPAQAAASVELLREIGGIEIRERMKFAAPAYVTLAAQMPLGLGLAPGERWRIRPGVWAVARSATVDGYWSDARLEPLRGQPIEQLVAISHRTAERGRVVWIGPGLEAVRAVERNRADWEKLFLNSVYWAARRPFAAVSTWPGGHDAAIVIAQEVHEAAEVPEAVAMAQSLAARQVRGTFFLRLTRGEVPNRLAELAQLGEVAAFGDGAGSDPAQQKQWLEQTLRMPVLGFRVPGERVDEDAPRMLAEMGYSYYLGGAAVLSAAPAVEHFAESILFPLDARTMVGLPRLSQGDFAVLSEYEGPSYSEEAIAAELWRDFERARRVGGLYVLNYRTDLLGSGPARPAVLRVIDRARVQGAWVASASEVAEWCRRREQIGVEVARLTPRRLRIVLTNNGSQDLENVLVNLSLPYVPKGLTVSPTVYGEENLSHEVVAGPEMMRVRANRLKAQSNQTWVLDFK